MVRPVNRKYFILLPICCLFLFNAAKGQHQPHEATFFGHIKLKKIPVNIGSPFIVKQFCTTTVEADRFFFENVTIGKIKSCKLDYAMRNDTIQSITIHLTGHKNYDAAKKQAQKQFGNAVIVFDLNAEIYSWLTKNQLQDVQVMLQRKNMEWGAEMVIHPAGL
jgi:hypothetical protein